MKKLQIIAMLLLIGVTATAQNYGEIKGRIVDATTGEALPFASVYVDKGTSQLGGFADENGKFRIKPLEPGSYDLHVRNMTYKEHISTGVEVKSNEITVLGDIKMELGEFETIVVTGWIEDLISPDNPTKMTISAPDLVKRADVRNTSDLVTNLIPGVTKNENGGLNFKGARPQNFATFIDGVRIGGGDIPRLPSNAINNLTVYTGGIPASYGDVTGGVVIIETKGYFDFYREAKRKEDALNRELEAQAEKDAKVEDEEELEEEPQIED